MDTDTDTDMAMALQTQIDCLNVSNVNSVSGVARKRLSITKQTDRIRDTANTRWVILLSLLSAGTVGSAHGENWQIKPRLVVLETLTNNARTSESNSSSDLISVITPGISIDGKGARSSLRLDYGLSGIFHVRDSSANRHQNSLNATGNIEAVEDWLFIDGTGSISQQYLNPVGAVSPSNANSNTNQTETSHYSISPYIKGRLLSSADYLLRYRVSTTSSKSNVVADLQASEWSGALNGLTPLSAVTWSIDAKNSHNDYSFGKDYDATSYGGTLIYRFNPEWRFSVNAGQESNNYTSVNQQTRNTSGYGFVWTPGPLTELSASKSNRFFGNGYDISFKHRMPRSQITYRASKDVSFLPSTVLNSFGSNYDNLYPLVAAANPGSTPQAIRDHVLGILQQYNISPNGEAVFGSLSNSPHLNKSQELTMAFLGARNTVTFTATDSERQPFTPIIDQLMLNRIKQRGVGVFWAHHLTGLTTLTLALNHQQARTFGNNVQETTTDGAYLFLSTRISPKTQGNIGVRRILSDGAAHYSESALTGGFTHSF